MSPELERLLEALYEKFTCPAEDKAQRVATFERLSWRMPWHEGRAPVVKLW